MLKRIIGSEKEKTGVLKNILWIMILANVSLNTLSAILSPVIFQEILPKMQNAYVYFNLFTLGVNMVSASIVANKKILAILDKYFITLVVVDTVMYIIVSIIGIDYKLVRLFGMAFITTTTTTMWSAVFRRTLNKYIKGDELTAYQNASSKYMGIGMFLGAILAIPVVNIPNIYFIGTVILVVAMIGAGLVDIYTRATMLKNIAPPDNNIKEGVVSGATN